MSDNNDSVKGYENVEASIKQKLDNSKKDLEQIKKAFDKYKGVDLSEAQLKILGLEDKAKEKAELEENIKEIEEVLIDTKEQLMDVIAEKIKNSKDKIEEYKKDIEAKKQEKADKEKELKVLTDKEAKGEELTDEEEDRKIDLESEIANLDKKIESREGKLQSTESQIKDLDTKLKEHKEKYKALTGKEYKEKTEPSQDETKDGDEKKAEENKPNEKKTQTQKTAGAGNYYGQPATQSAEQQAKEENIREFDEYGTDAEVYSLFLKNVPSIGNIARAKIGMNSFFQNIKGMGKRRNINDIKKSKFEMELDKSVANVLDNMKPEEYDMLMRMFTNPVSLTYFKVPDQYCDSIKTYLRNKQKSLDENAPDYQDKSDEINNLLVEIENAKADKNERTGNKFKKLVNKKEVLMLAEKNRQVRETVKSGDQAKAKSLGSDLGKFVNNEIDVPYKEAQGIDEHGDTYIYPVKKEKGFGNTKLTNENSTDGKGNPKPYKDYFDKGDR